MISKTSGTSEVKRSMHNVHNDETIPQIVLESKTKIIMIIMNYKALNLCRWDADNKKYEKETFYHK